MPTNNEDQKAVHKYTMILRDKLRTIAQEEGLELSSEAFKKFIQFGCDCWLAGFDMGKSNKAQEMKNENK